MTAWLPRWCKKLMRGERISFGVCFESCVIFVLRNLFEFPKTLNPSSRNLSVVPVPVGNKTAAQVSRHNPRKSFGSNRQPLYPRKIIPWLLLAGFCFLWPAISEANNVTVASAKLASRSTSAGTIQIQFDISWDNAWNDNVNNDAVWLVFKYSTDSGSTWSHATMKTSGKNPTGVSGGTKQSGSAFTALDIIVPEDKKGCFIQPRSLGAGTLDIHSVQVVWDYSGDGLSDSTVTNAATSVRIFAVEVVYVPTAAFYLGDGSATASIGSNGGATSKQLTSESEMTFASSGSSYWYYQTGSNSGEGSAGAAFAVPSGFPKGYSAFYIMKYEITEGQWIGFFNTLTSAQKTTRDITSATGKNTDAVSNRNTISWTGGTSAATTTRTDRAMSWLSWMDVCAYCDWAAMRPMTELEFEKAARGPLPSLAYEYAWGTTTITAAVTLSGAETGGTETITTSNANCVYNNNTFTNGDGTTGPLRAGILATSTTKTRDTTGGSHYGVMELSGNLWEKTVTIGNATGRAYLGTHGDGTLTTTSSYEGNATNTDWPGIDGTTARGVTGATGGGLRGASWYDAGAYPYVSARHSAALTTTSRANTYGGRCVRTDDQV